MSVLDAFPGEICWSEVWIDMWALERSVGVLIIYEGQAQGVHKLRSYD
jgi:hypothetical protein